DQYADVAGEVDAPLEFQAEFLRDSDLVLEAVGGKRQQRETRLVHCSFGQEKKPHTRTKNLRIRAVFDETELRGQIEHVVRRQRARAEMVEGVPRRPLPPYIEIP